MQVATTATTLAPSYPGHWLRGAIEDRRQRPLEMFAQMSAMADVTQFRAYWIRVFQVHHPDAVKHVLVDHAANYVKGRLFETLSPLLGHGLFTAEGDLWKRNRRLAQPAFHRERLALLVEMMGDATARVLDGWERHADSGERFNVAPDMMSLTMSVVARALFSADVTGDAAEVGAALGFALEETNRRLLSFNFLDRVFPRERSRAYTRAIATLDAIVLRIIEERRRSGERRDDLLSMFMEAKDADTGESMNDRQLRDEAMTMFLAGHETTAVLLSWLWYVLDRHPEVQERLRAELGSVLGGRRPTAADLPRLGYLQRVIDETLRLYPPVWVLGREAVTEDRIMGYRIPAGAIISISPWTLHRSTKFWSNPERFDPDRFLPEQKAARPKHAYLPFGAGQRMCIGNNFALMEAQVIVAMALQRYRIRVPADHQAVPDPLVTLRPKGGLPVTVTRV